MGYHRLNYVHFLTIMHISYMKFCSTQDHLSSKLDLFLLNDLHSIWLFYKIDKIKCCPCMMVSIISTCSGIMKEAFSKTLLYMLSPREIKVQSAQNRFQELFLLSNASYIEHFLLNSLGNMVHIKQPKHLKLFVA